MEPTPPTMANVAPGRCASVCESEPGVFKPCSLSNGHSGAHQSADGFPWFTSSATNERDTCDCRSGDDTACIVTLAQHTSAHFDGRFYWTDAKPDLLTIYPPTLSDDVNHPKHYTSYPVGIEAIDVTEHFNFNMGNAIKYIWRADLKGKPIEDLKKAAWYIQREIERRSKVK